MREFHRWVDGSFTGKQIKTLQQVACACSLILKHHNQKKFWNHRVGLSWNMSVAFLKPQFDWRTVDRSAVVLNESLREIFFFHRCEIIWPSGKTRRWQLDSVSCLLTFKIITAATFIFPSQYVCLRPLYLRLHLFFDCPLHRKTITWTPSRLFLSLLASKSLVVKLQDERMK